MSLAIAAGCSSEDGGNSSETTAGAGATSGAASGAGGDTSSSATSTSGNGTSTAASTGSGGSPSCSNDTQIHSGSLTYYNEANQIADSGTGHCSLPKDNYGYMIGAMNTADYADSAVCGACVELTHANKTIQIRIIDECPVSSNPKCAQGHIDLSPSAFQQLEPLATGYVTSDVQWKYIPCDAIGNIEWVIKQGSNQYWTAVEVRNHRYPIAKVEVMQQNQWLELERLPFNYWMHCNGACNDTGSNGTGFGPGPYTLRATDIHGHVIQDQNITLSPGNAQQGSGQFPACAN